MGTKAKWLKRKLTFWNEAVVYDDISSTAGIVGGTTIRNWGVVVLSPSVATSYFINGGPAIGQKLDIVVDTSFVASVFASTGAGSSPGGVTISGSSFNGIVFKTSAGKPQSAQLRGDTTTRWQLTSFSTMTGGFNLTTAIA